MTIYEQIKKELANEIGCENWDELRLKLGPKTMDIYERKLCNKYAYECSKTSLQKASESVIAYIGNEGTEDTPLVSQRSITNPDNIVLL